MDLTEVLNQKLNKLTSDFIEFQKDLQTCFDSLPLTKNNNHSKEIIRFLVETQMEIAKLKEEIYKTEKQIKLVTTAENKEFQKDFTEVYSEKEVQLLQDAFNTHSSFYQNNTSQNNDLDEPRTR